MTHSVDSAVVRSAAGAAALGILTVIELLRPLRTPTRPKLRRLGINVVFTAIAGAAVGALYGPVVFRGSRLAAAHGVGLLHWLGVNGPLRVVLAVVGLDYTLWVWHWLNHKVPLLWRFHAAHHADLDLDASTALRFHPGELVLSVGFRALQVVLLGIAIPDLLLWEGLLLVSIEFHHSNVRLPERFERVLRNFLMSPRLHGIHHSIAGDEADTNFGTILTIWDRLHRTWSVDVPQDRIVIGIPQVQPPWLGLLASLAVPFRRELPRPARWVTTRTTTRR
jgi:sterol desaturase/sphingolipid hydroxylase (fatty acid hydroxylase superfamily)